MEGDVVSALPLYHAVTGCDSTRQFYGLGKKSTWSTQVSSSAVWIVHREHKQVYLSSQHQSGGAIHNVVFKIGGAAWVDKFSPGAVVSCEGWFVQAATNKWCHEPAYPESYVPSIGLVLCCHCKTRPSFSRNMWLACWPRTSGTNVNGACREFYPVAVEVIAPWHSAYASMHP